MDEAESGRLVIRLERRGVRRYTCSGCGRRTGQVRSTRERTWEDLPWAAHHVTLVYAQRRLVCRSCGIRTERIEFADPKARVKRRPRHIGLDEIHRGKGQRFWTVLSDVVHGEVIGLRHDRSERPSRCCSLRN